MTTSEALRERLRSHVRPGKRGWYRAGYARALDDIAAIFRSMDLGVTAQDMANALDSQAEEVRRGTEA